MQKLMLTQEQKQYTLNRTAKGVYIYTDKPKSTNTKNIFISEEDVINN